MCSIEASAETTAQTGVEMEALTAAAVAALTVYDMAKAIDKDMVVEDDPAPREDEGARVRAAVLTVSDGVAAGVRDDRSGDLLDELLRADGFEVERRVVPDEPDQIAAGLRELSERAELVVSTGGTGVAPRDVTPEVTRGLLETRGARHTGGDPGRQRLEDAARTALARDGRDTRARRSSSTCQARRAAAGTATR